jgi:hypothetical protein
MLRDIINAKESDLYDKQEIITRNNKFIAISAGTIDADLLAKTSPLFSAIKIKAIIMVEGIVPKMPPTFVPYFSAIIVITITIKADNKNGRTICNNISVILRQGIFFAYKTFSFFKLI